MDSESSEGLNIEPITGADAKKPRRIVQPLASHSIKEAAMSMQLKSVTLAMASLAMLGGCLNMPTPPSQITGSYTSGLRYENFDCSRLSVELDSLARRENQLVIAQEQRIKSSEMQGCLWGFGQGDGIEASELANVRGEKEAVRKAMEINGCKGATSIRKQD